MIHIMTAGCAAIAGFLTFYLLLSVKGRMNDIGVKTYVYVNRRLKERRSRFFNYYELESFLKKNGAGYLFGRFAEPVKYLGLCILFSMMGVLAGSAAGPVCAMGLGVFAFFIPRMLILYNNSIFNERLLGDLRVTYQFIAIQTAAGVYISDALAECRDSVENKRLRDAFIRLGNDIATENDIEKALGNFSECFDNPHISTFCVIIRQSLESGRSLDLLQDVNDQLKEVEENILFKKQEKLNRKIGFIQVIFFTGAMFLFLYAFVYGSQNVLINF